MFECIKIVWCIYAVKLLINRGAETEIHIEVRDVALCLSRTIDSSHGTSPVYSVKALNLVLYFKI